MRTQAYPWRLLGYLLFVLLVLMLATRTYSADAVLYDGALGTPPAAQHMVFGSEPNPPAGASELFIPGAVELATITVPNDKAGYAGLPTAMPNLDRQAGFTLRFTLQILAEQHEEPDRAGFSVLLIANDGYGIELGFWADEIWAQATEPQPFSHGEGVPTDTTVRRTYTLTVLGDTYSLTADATPLLSGPLRTYSSFGQPYAQVNFVFLGDNTTSAGATIRLFDVAFVSTALPTPTATQTASASPSVTPTITQTRATVTPSPALAASLTPTSTIMSTKTPGATVTPSLTALATATHPAGAAPTPSATLAPGGSANLFTVYLPSLQQ